jgi:Asp-tRNA(Asn)/Glu-tRNA(Gln) amidotransferase A subunit family amidase
LLISLPHSQFANGDQPTADWIDYHCPYNARGDGYLKPFGSSAGSGAGIASYPLIDFSIGSDTGGSVRAPAAANGAFGMRPTGNATILDGICPISPLYGSVGALSANISVLETVTKAWYGKMAGLSMYTKFPKKIFYPVDFFPKPNNASQKVYDAWFEKFEALTGLRGPSSTCAPPGSQQVAFRNHSACI